MKKKKVIIIAIPILLIAFICFIIFFINQNNTEKHIYYKDGTIRGFKRWTNTREIFPTLKEIYGEMPYEDSDGTIYEYISNFDLIDDCDAKIKYKLYDEDSLYNVFIYLKSKKYTYDELYDIIYTRFCNIYGDPIIETDKYNNPTGEHWETESSWIYIKECDMSDGDYQMRIYFSLD